MLNYVMVAMESGDQRSDRSCGNRLLSININGTCSRIYYVTVLTLTD
jgi:hypothetical protein